MMAQNETAKQFRQMGTDILSIRSSNSAGMNLAEVQGLATVTPKLAAVAPFSSGSALAVYGGSAVNATVIGVSEAFGKIANLRMQEGRFISDLDRYELYCVVGSALAENLSRGVPLRPGSELRIGRYQFLVLSILAPALTNPMMPADVNNSVFISIPNSKRVTPTATLNTALARVRPGSIQISSVRS